MSATEQSTYSGWTNYETWAVKLWIDNEQSSHEYWREMARESRKVEPQWDFETKEQAQVRVLSDWLKGELDTNAEGLPQASMYADLLNAALSSVNWREIAESMLGDL